MQLPNANKARVIMLVEHTVSHIYVYKGFIYLFNLKMCIRERDFTAGLGFTPCKCCMLGSSCTQEEYLSISVPTF